MYKIVIADDEHLERMVLRQALEEYLGARCMIRTATNGREAVECALLIRADLVVMDIEMPGINGLEASDTIHRELPGCKIVILTAYSEFSYAQKAIEFGAVDYLLKPCSDRELHAMIDRVTARIDEERASERRIEEFADRVRMLTTQVEEQLVLTVMGGHISPDYVLEKLQELGIAFDNGVFAILSAHPGTGDLGTVITSRAWPEHIHPVSYLYDGRLYILSISDIPAVSCASVTEAQLRRFSDAAQILWGSPLFCALGGGFSTIDDAQASCFQAQLALVRCTDENPVQSWKHHDAEGTGDPLVNSILIGSEAAIAQVAHSLVGNLSAQHLEWSAAVTRLESMLSRAVDTLRDEMGIPVPPVRLGRWADADMDSLRRELAGVLTRLADHTSKEMESRQDGHLGRIKSEIEDYVAAHYHEDIFLPGVAREMHYSSAYFSKLFKQCFQRNFIIYLTDVRIAAAKELLRGTTLTIREIGERVGYKDSNYFTKVFRKTTGMNPTEYRAENAPDRADDH